MSLHTNTRLDYLDAVRSFALILGIVFHACLSFMPIFIGWAVMDISTSSVIGTFALIAHSFRMELFFLIAGYFAHMKFHQQGFNAFMQTRLVRIAIPFIIGWFLLRPLLIWGWTMGAASMRGDVNFISSITDSFTVFTSSEESLFVGTHLWFLYYLLLISTSVVLIRYFVCLNTSIKQFITQLSDKLIIWLCNSRLAIIAIAVPTTCCLWFMNHWGVDTPDKSLIPNIPVTLLYGSFFLFGWCVHRQSELMEKFASLSWGKVLLAISAITGTILLSKFEANLAHSQYFILKITFLLSYSMMMWSLVSLTIAACKILFKRQSKHVRYIADASYWLYLIHLPIVIWLQIAFAELALYWAIKLVSICVLTLIISLALYDAFIRSTFIGATLNGKKHTRVLFGKRDNSNKMEYVAAPINKD